MSTEGVLCDVRECFAYFAVKSFLAAKQANYR